MQNSKQYPIVEITKNDFSKYLVTIDEFKDSIFLSIRQYHKDTDETWKPTKKQYNLASGKG